MKRKMKPVNLITLLKKMKWFSVLIVVLASYSVHEFLKFYMFATFSWRLWILLLLKWRSPLLLPLCAIYQHRSILLVFHILFDKMRRHNILRGLHIIIEMISKIHSACIPVEGSRNIDLWPLTWNRTINIQSE